MIAFVLVRANPARVQDTLATLQRQGHLEVHLLFGEWDILIKLQADGPQAVTDQVARILATPGVLDTRTLTSLQGA